MYYKVPQISFCLAIFLCYFLQNLYCLDYKLCLYNIYMYIYIVYIQKNEVIISSKTRLVLS